MDSERKEKIYKVIADTHEVIDVVARAKREQESIVTHQAGLVLQHKARMEELITGLDEEDLRAILPDVMKLAERAQEELEK